jgi:hypothetical protein
MILALSSSSAAETGFRVNAGMTRISYDDYNDFADIVNEDLAVFGTELENLNWLPELQGEFLYSPLPLITFGAGAGMIFGKAELSSSLIGNLEYGVRSYPITMTGYFKPELPLMPVKPYAFCGIGMYYSKITCEFSTDIVEGIYESTDLSTWGFGIHGGAGLEFSILPMLSLEVGVRGRWADIKGFEGTGTDAAGNRVDVFLVADDVEVEYQGQTYQAAAFGPWSKEDQDRYQEGSRDITGYGFVLGLKLAF